MPYEIKFPVVHEYKALFSYDVLDPEGEFIMTGKMVIPVQSISDKQEHVAEVAKDWAQATLEIENKDFKVSQKAFDCLEKLEKVN